MMLPIIMNTTFQALGAIDDYISFIWASRYYKSGDFELVLGPTYKALNYIKEQYYVARDDDDLHLGIIEKIRVEEDEQGAQRMIVTGRFLESILARRIVAIQTQFNNQYVSAVISDLITENAISSSTAARNIPNLTIGSFGNMGPQISVQYTGKNLLDVISELGKKYGLGFYIRLVNGDFVFNMYEGLDRTFNQSVNDRVIFSQEYGNLLSAEYEENYQNLVTDVLAAGEGEGLSRKTIWVDNGNSPTGLARYEHYQDMRDIQSNNGEISDVDYYAQLAQRGREHLTTFTSAFAGEADFTNVRYKTDLNLGDLCVIRQSQWGINVNARLVEVIESVDEAGLYTITPSFEYSN